MEVSSKKSVIIGIIGIITLIIIGVLIGISGNKDLLIIDNISSYRDRIPRNLEENIRGALYNIVKSNIDDEKKIPSKGVLIRDNSFYSEYDEYDEITSSDFIIDINSLRQSYYIQFEYGENISSTAVVVSCLPDDTKIIYDDFKCKDEYTFNEKNDDPYIFIGNKLPYFLELENNNFAIISYGSNDTELKIRINNCSNVNQSIIIEKARTWVDSLFISPESFKYKVECKIN